MLINESESESDICNIYIPIHIIYPFVTTLCENAYTRRRRSISPHANRNLIILSFYCSCRYLTRVPHVAGTPADLQGAKHIRDTWESQGLDTVNIKAYKVLLQYPSSEKGKENKVN